MLEDEGFSNAVTVGDEIHESGSIIYFVCENGYHLRRNGSMFPTDRFFLKCELDADGINANWHNPFFELEKKPSCESKYKDLFTL